MSDTPVWSRQPGGILLRVLVTPRASRNALQGLIDLPDGPALKIAVTAPPEDVKANIAVLKLLAKALHLPPTSLSVASGTTARSKSILIPGDAATLAPMLEALRKSNVERAGTPRARHGEQDHEQ